MSLLPELKDLVNEYIDLSVRIRGDEPLRIVTQKIIDNKGEEIIEVFNIKVASGLWFITMGPWIYNKLQSYRALILHKEGIPNVSIDVRKEDEPPTESDDYVDNIILCQEQTPLLSVGVNMRNDGLAIFNRIYTNNSTIALLFRRDNGPEYAVGRALTIRFGIDKAKELSRLFPLGTVVRSEYGVDVTNLHPSFLPALFPRGESKDEFWTRSRKGKVKPFPQGKGVADFVREVNRPVTIFNILFRQDVKDLPEGYISLQLKTGRVYYKKDLLVPISAGIDEIKQFYRIGQQLWNVFDGVDEDHEDDITGDDILKALAIPEVKSEYIRYMSQWDEGVYDKEIPNFSSVMADDILAAMGLEEYI